MKKYINQFKAIDKHGVWPDNTAAEIIIAQAKLAVADITAKAPYTQSKKLYRLAGQSGSGKSTQLLPALTAFNKSKNNNPITIAVRDFAPYHPDYANIAKTYEKGAIRERTNGFALKCLCAAYSMLMEIGVAIILDLTIMGEWFEKFMLDEAQSHNYEINYHILAVNKSISNSFIAKRKADSKSPEYGKIVNLSSINLWYDDLTKGVNFLAHNDKQNKCFVWTAFDKMPIYCGTMDMAPAVLESGRAKTGALLHDEKVLLASKIEFIINSAK